MSDNFFHPTVELGRHNQLELLSLKFLQHVIILCYADMDDSDSGDLDYNPVIDDDDSSEEPKLQPVGQAGSLLSSVLGIMVINFAAFPIHVRSWRHMTEYKEREYDRQIKEENKATVKKVVLAKLGKIWKDKGGIY
ncbi:hypothetical protein PIB30_057045 [Stylosanthes scabra]|uniref:Uncharacterized protein n=1 Tax=Stylosanthes scabra TaxID=79078 RepID=A0ABU6WLI6_9FABA|nr:hypothetical protein [Stylosanthes scabra]